MDRRRVSIVIPALNEGPTIGRVVDVATARGTCIVVDDGSTDDTVEQATKAGAVVVRHAWNLGYDAALDTGFRTAAEQGAEVIVTLDADGQHDPRLIDRLLEAIDNGADLALGVRHRRARLAEHVFAAYTRLRWGVRDPLCGLKAYRAALFRERGHFDCYRSIGTELMLFGLRKGRRAVQVPFQVADRADQPRMGRRFAANAKILRALLLSGRSARQRC